MSNSVSSKSNKRIAKNTIYLYLRTIVVLIVALYSSRLLLKALGETDLGVYNVVGGIVALMSFFERAQAKATSRFITFDLGSSASSSRLSHTFSVCVTIHLLIALIVLFFGETIGLWIVNNWVSIPDDRFQSALIVYQCAIMTFCMHLMRIPFSSVIIAHEEMSVYAYISIIEVLLQLIAVLYLQYYGGDALILYGFSILLISMVVFILYWLYIRKKHALYKLRLVWDGTYSKKILSFSGWTMVGSTANTATQQGLSLLLNNFVGLVANTALGFATQVNGAVGKFVGSFTTAFNPQIIKLYAQGKWDDLHVMISRASKFSFALAYLMALPLIANMDYVLSIWLDTVPKYTVGFCQLILVCATIDATTGCFNTAVTATGKIKWYQICISISFVLDLICSFILLLMKFNPVLVFGSRILTRGFLNMFIGLYFIRHNIHFGIFKYLKSIMIPISIIIFVTSFSEAFVVSAFKGIVSLVVSTILGVLMIACCTWFLLCSQHERKVIKGYLLKVLK